LDRRSDLPRVHPCHHLGYSYPARSVARRVFIAIGGLTYPLHLLHQQIGYVAFNWIGADARPAALIATIPVADNASRVGDVAVCRGTMPTPDETGTYEACRKNWLGGQAELSSLLKNPSP
jgi:hypothetical protein